MSTNTLSDPIDLGSNAVHASSTTITATVLAALPAGSLVVVGGLVGGNVAINSVTDSRGNTYTRDALTGFGSTVGAIASFHSVITTALQAGDTFTMTMASSVADQTIRAIGFTGKFTSTPLDKSVVSSQGAGLTATTGNTGTLVTGDEVVIAFFAGTLGATTGSPSSISGYTQWSDLFNASATNRVLASGYKFPGATTSLNASVTWHSSQSQSAWVLVTFHASLYPVGGTSAGVGGGSKSVVASKTAGAVSAGVGGCSRTYSVARNLGAASVIVGGGSALGAIVVAKIVGAISRARLNSAPVLPDTSTGRTGILGTILLGQGLFGGAGTSFYQEGLDKTIAYVRSAGAISSGVAGVSKFIVTSIAKIAGGVAPGAAQLNKMALYAKTVGAAAVGVGGAGQNKIASIGGVSEAVGGADRVISYSRTVGASSTAVAQLARGGVSIKDFGASSTFVAGADVQVIAAKAAGAASATQASVERAVVYVRSAGATSTTVGSLSRPSITRVTVAGAVATAVAGAFVRSRAIKTAGAISPVVSGADVLHTVTKRTGGVSAAVGGLTDEEILYYTGPFEEMLLGIGQEETVLLGVGF